MITTTISTDVLATGAPLDCPSVHAPVAMTAVAAAPASWGHVSLQDATPVKRDRVVTTDVFATVPGLPAWSPPT